MYEPYFFTTVFYSFVQQVHTKDLNSVVFMEDGKMMKKNWIAAAGLAMAFSATAVYAEDCAVTIDSTDTMKFDTDVIVVKKDCKNFTVNLTHSGKLAKNVMGHNWVLTASDDVLPVAREGMSAGLDNSYLKPGDERVIAFSDIIGGGEKTSVTFAVDKLDPAQVYTFFCSFPGHYSVMRGTLSIK
jgi:azurin